MTEWHQQIGFSAEILQGLGLLARAHLRVAQFFDRNHALALKSYVKSLVDCAKASLAHQLNDTVASTKQTTNDQGSCYMTTTGGASSGCIHRLSGNWANRAACEFIPTVRAKLISRRIYRTTILTDNSCLSHIFLLNGSASDWTDLRTCLLSELIYFCSISSIIVGRDWNTIDGCISR